MQELLGTPTEKMLFRAKRKSYFTDDDGEMIPYKPAKGKPRKPGSKPIESVVKTDDKKFLDFLHRCICWDPNDRMTPTEALNHEWVLEGLPDYLKQEHLL